MFNEYLEATKYVDYDTAAVRAMAEKIKSEASDELELIEKTYLFVRDGIRHSWDAQDTRVTVSAGDT